MCIHNENLLIPSKITYNWDWQLYPVSFIAHRYLTNSYKNGNQLNITLNNNQTLYNLLPILLETHNAKILLHKIVSFADTCRLADVRTSLFAKDEDFW